VRLALVLAGLPAPEVQYEVIDEWGRPVARLDLAYPARRVAIEYDGAVHFDEVKARSDRQRDAILAGYGWQTVRLTSADLGSALPITVGRIRRLLAARALFPSPKPT
jgi:very-short-patch-repair endonuclease